MARFRSLLLAAAVLSVITSSGQAFFLREYEEFIWKTIVSYPGETEWDACRRVFRTDARLVRRVSGNRVQCKVYLGYLYDSDEVRTNFN